MNKHLRLARLIEIMSLIKHHPDWGPKQLAEYFSISKKRIYDDINELNAANIPIIFNGKGYSFLTPQPLAPVQFTLDEALSMLISATVLESQKDGEYSLAVRSAVTKLLDLIPDNTRRLLLELSGKVKLDTKGRQITDPALKQLSQAIGEKRTIEFSYQSYSSGALTRRKMDPYGLVFRGNSWYVIGHCHKRREVRTFRLSRIGALRVTGGAYKYPDDFSIERHLEKSWQIFQGAETDVKIKFSKKVAPLIMEHQWQKDQRITKNRDGSIVYSTTVKGTLEIMRWALSWGREAEVIEPEELRRDMALASSGMSAIYGAGEPANERVKIRKVAESKAVYKIKKTDRKSK